MEQSRPHINLASGRPMLLALLAALACNPPWAPDPDNRTSFRIRATKYGFNPYHVEVPAGQQTHFEFVREADAMPCTDQVLIPSLGVRGDVPSEGAFVLNVKLKPGTYKFTCGGHMMSGEIIAR